MDITDMLNFINSLAPDSISKVKGFVDNIIKYSLMMAAGITLLHVAHKIVVSFLKPNEPINPSSLVRPILVLAALTLYKEINEQIIEPFARGLELLAEEGAGQPPTDYLGLGMRALTYINAGTGGSTGIFDILQVNPLLELIHLVIFIVSSLVIIYIYFKQLVVKSIYYVIGIIVLPLSLIPGNEKAINKWFFGYLSVLLWIPLLHILMYIISSLNYIGNDGVLNTALNFFMNKYPVVSIALQVLMIMLVLNIPKYANIIVGGEGSEIGGIANAIKKAPGRIYGAGGIAGKAMRAAKGGKS